MTVCARERRGAERGYHADRYHHGQYHAIQHLGQSQSSRRAISNTLPEWVSSRPRVCRQSHRLAVGGGRSSRAGACELNSVLSASSLLACRGLTLFQSRAGITVLFGHVKWPQGRQVSDPLYVPLLRRPQDLAGMDARSRTRPRPDHRRLHGTITGWPQPAFRCSRRTQRRQAL